MEEDNSIKIPIKDILEKAVSDNGCKFPEDEFNMIRKYFIACLNLGYLVPKDLITMVNKFCNKIKVISLDYNGLNKLDYYLVNGPVLYTNRFLKDSNIDLYEINYYKAISEVIFNVNDNHISLSNALCEMTAEKVHNMDVNESRIIMPKTSLELVGGVNIQLRAGYINYNLTINLLKQLFISKEINENKLIHEMFFEGYDTVIKEVLTDDNMKLVIDVLDKITVIMINRKTKNEFINGEKELIDKYQIIVNSLFKNIDQNYLAFCALITTDELRDKCMSQIKSKVGE